MPALIPKVKNNKLIVIINSTYKLTCFSTTTFTVNFNGGHYAQHLMKCLSIKINQANYCGKVSNCYSWLILMEAIMLNIYQNGCMLKLTKQVILEKKESL